MSFIESPKAKIIDFNKVLEIAARSGYQISQSNGQRVFGPPIKSQFTRPNKCCELFIGNIPRDILENKLISMFMTCGKIYEFRLMLDFGGNNRGFAFVLFYDKISAENAIKLFNEYEMLEGKRLAVVQSVNNDRLYVCKSFLNVFISFNFFK